MKKALFALLVLVIMTGAIFADTTAKDPYDLQIKRLYSAPDQESNEILAIPIEVKLLDISADGNWYKVKIAYWIGPLSYTYVGWTEIPVGQALAERASKLAKAPPDKTSEE
ncbi:MAG: hypothetical protein PHH14_01850 [Candidatus Margulisbacteria bacterium]|nr:hypothetical protein [Candidatus Margulisiibacteriota bacterium]